MYKSNNILTLTFTFLSPFSQASPGHKSLLIWFFTQLCGLFTWEMLPGPGSACYWTSMSWLSWPLHTSLTQSDKSKTTSITYSYWYNAFTSQLLQFRMYVNIQQAIFSKKNPTKVLEKSNTHVVCLCCVFIPRCSQFPSILEPIIGTLPRLFASQTPQYHTGSRRVYLYH